MELKINYSKSQIMANLIFREGFNIDEKKIIEKIMKFAYVQTTRPVHCLEGADWSGIAFGYLKYTLKHFCFNGESMSERHHRKRV